MKPCELSRIDLHADVEHHEEDAEFGEHIERFTPMQQSKQRRTQYDTDDEFSENRRIAQVRGKPAG